MRSVLGGSALAALLVVAGCGGDEPETLAGITRDEPLQVGEVVLPDVTAGASSPELRMAADPGRLLVTYFGYTHCPDVCPTTMFDLANAFERIGDDADLVDVAFVTVDPDRDTAEVLNGYLEYFFDEHFHAVRPDDREQIETAQAAFGASSSVSTADDGEVEVSHSAITYVVDPNGSVVVEWPFGTSGESMADDLEILFDQQQEAS